MSIPLYRLTHLESRASSAENRSGGKGQGGKAGGGLKGSPAIKDFQDETTVVLLDTEGPGQIRHIWCTSTARDPFGLRNQILRIYWEGSDIPSVEAPLGDFFGAAHGAAVPLVSSLITMQEGRGFNCYIPMPFERRAVVTITNETGRDIDWFFYQIDFTRGDAVTDEDGRFHARFHRENPCPLGRDFSILETRHACGIYLGSVLGVRPLAPRWWGEGEVKIYLDGDEAHPTICGTGTEDYIGSAWGLGQHCTPYQGAPLVTPEFTTLYRFHVPDPVYFQQDIRVELQQMGNAMKDEVLAMFGSQAIWAPKNHPRRAADDVFYLRSDDWCATAYWFQWPLAENRPPLADKDARSADLFGVAPRQGEAEGL